jgi:hypothetical protein
MRAKALAVAAPALPTWDAEGEAIRAAGFVAAFVAVPAVVAASVVLLLFALTWLVLVAPIVAIVLTWAVWRSNRLPAGERREAGVAAGARTT